MGPGQDQRDQVRIRKFDLGFHDEYESSPDLVPPIFTADLFETWSLFNKTTKFLKYKHKKEGKSLFSKYIYYEKSNLYSNLEGNYNEKKERIN